MAAGWNKGRKWSDEVKQRISEAMLKNHPMRGRHWSLEIRQRQSKAHREALELRRKQILLLMIHFEPEKNSRLFKY